MLLGLLSPAGKPDTGNRTPLGFLHIRAMDALLSEGQHFRLQVFAHEVKFVLVVPIGGMESGLCLGQSEDQPALASVYGRESKDITEKGAISHCVLAVDDHMRTRNHELCPFFRLREVFG